jgi:tetratricopeptide (TPR) repeat protein
VSERKLDKAVRELRRALELHPDNVEAAAGLEDVRRRQAEEQAERKRTEAAARSAEARAHVERALALLNAAKADKAAREVQRALELEPGRSDAVAALEQIQRRQAENAAARREAEAEEARARAMERELEAARVALKQKDFTRAAQAAEKALQLQGAHPPNDPAAAAPPPPAIHATTQAPQLPHVPGPVRAVPRSVSAWVGRLPKPVLFGAALLVVVIVGFLALRWFGPATAPAGSPAGAAQQPATPMPGDAAKAPNPTVTTPAAMPTGAGPAQPEADATKTAPVAPTAATTDAQKPDSGRGAPPTVRRRQGETVAAWYARDRETARRYEAARASLEGREFDAALSALGEIERAEPGYRDVPALMTAAREGLHASAQQAMDAGAKADAASDWPAAVQHYERAARLDPSVSAAAEEAARNLRGRMAKEGDKAFSAAGVYDALGRTAEAIAMYERALKYLPADHPNARTAKERLDALRK